MDPLVTPEAGTDQPTAPVAPTAPPAPGIADAIAAAREKLATGQPIVDAPPAPVAAPPVDPTAPVAPETQADPSAPAPGPEGEPAPLEGDPTESAPPEGGESLVVELPGRRPGEEPVAVEVTDPAVAERLRQAVNGYERRADSEARLAEAQGMIREYEQVVEYATADPVSFTLNNIPPDLHDHLLLRLLSQDTVWQRLQDRVFELADDSVRENVRLRLENQEAKNREAMEARAQARVAAERSARSIGKAVDKIVAGLPADARASAREEVMGTIKQHALRTKVASMDVQDIPVVAASTLRKLGINPLMVPDLLAGRSPAQPAAPRPTAPAKAGAPTGQQFVRAAAQKAAAARVAPVGAGAPSANIPQPPKGLGVKETIQWVRENRALSR